MIILVSPPCMASLRSNAMQMNCIQFETLNLHNFLCFEFVFFFSVYSFGMKCIIKFVKVKVARKR